ncbi:putative glycosyltransferase [Saliniradius amylolyticus]|uniref:Putative glycosyltransferase n=1 Tax=Saliniradius amylolyticus TaxID=2183582 RepID=A0A2S2E0P4_9ALTE|nr:glycosyltransferase family 2 protein [Saliniradius amylolyticus]AWL11225.1 putative glycosyltransferase [Saliniradius amylolyticus]
MLISIVCPVFNAANFLDEFLGSLLKQTSKSFEVIFVDDCSSDDSLKILSSFQSTDFKVKVVRNEKNLGPGPTRNIGLNYVSGDYVCFFDPDDVIATNAVEVILKYAEFGDYDLLRGNGKYFILDQSSEKYPLPNIKTINNKFCEKDEINEAHGLPWYHVVFAFKVEKLKRICLKYPDLRVGEDPVFLFNALSRLKNCYFFPETIYYYRTNPDEVRHFNTIEKLKDFCEHLEEMSRIAQTYSQMDTFERYFRDTFWFVFESYILYNDEALSECTSSISKVIKTVKNKASLANDEFHRLLVDSLLREDAAAISFIRHAKRMLDNEPKNHRHESAFSGNDITFYLTVSWMCTRPLRKISRFYFLIKDYIFLRTNRDLNIHEYVDSNPDVKSYFLGPYLHFLINGSYEKRSWSGISKFYFNDSLIPDSIFSGKRPLLKRK